MAGVSTPASKISITPVLPPPKKQPTKASGARSQKTSTDVPCLSYATTENWLLLRCFARNSAAVGPRTRLAVLVAVYRLHYHSLCNFGAIPPKRSSIDTQHQRGSNHNKLNTSPQQQITAMRADLPNQLYTPSRAPPDTRALWSAPFILCRATPHPGRLLSLYAPHRFRGLFPKNYVAY